MTLRPAALIGLLFLAILIGAFFVAFGNMDGQAYKSTKPSPGASPSIAPECSAGEIKYYTCENQYQVQWCTCAKGKWNCIKSPETQCSEEKLCGIYNVNSFDDPLGDATQGAPDYVDIKNVKIYQQGQNVVFEWEGNGSLENNDNQYYFLTFDTDFNPQTGQPWGGTGAEIKISLGSTATIGYFDAAGNVISEEYNIPVFFEGNKFYLNIEKSKLNFTTANFYFESSGGTPYRDEGSINLISLQSAQPAIKFDVNSSNKVLKDNPPLVNVPDKQTPVKLEFSILKGKSKVLVPFGQVSYTIYHPVERDPRIGKPAEIISVDSQGNAHYLREGFIFLSAMDKLCKVSLAEPLIMATGTVYGNPKKDPVIAVFPDDYATRESGSNTFGEMMQEYPAVMRTWNLSYSLSSKMYKGFKPFNGDKQIFSMMVSIYEPENPFACGNMNPLESDPTCYMRPDGTPGYDSPIHEMGHNFHETQGMLQLRFANNNRMNRPIECIASLPIIYMYADFTKNPRKYRLDVNSYEYNYFKQKLESDIPTIYPALNDFENQIKTGQISGYFDETGNFDKVAVFCDFFQIYAYDLTEDPNQYKQEVIPRFLGIFSDRELPRFVDEKSETYFGAAYSAAIGYDLRGKLKFWGFTIDDAYFDEIYPMLAQELG